ncbi:MAG: hypothetical protein HYZ53_04660 [Planctomycetes bacterium]|nr:hypothetical protein [Planctomycetota bacterium]
MSIQPQPLAASPLLRGLRLAALLCAPASLLALVLAGPLPAAPAAPSPTAPAPAPPAPSSIDPIVRSYLAAATPAERDALADDLRPLDALPVRALAESIRRVRTFSGHPGYQTLRLSFKDRDLLVHVYAPAAYSHDRSWPVLVSYQGPSTDGIEGLGVFVAAPDFAEVWRAHVGPRLRAQGSDPARARPPVWADARDYLVVSPDLPADHATRHGYPASETQNLVFQLMLREVFQAFHADTDRVFVTGLSQGGCWAWDDAAFRGDWLAGSLPVAGYAPDSPEEPCLPNLLTCPLYVMHGVADGDTPVDVARRPVAELRRLRHPQLVYREFPHGGHEWPRGEGPSALRWMADRRRASFPRHLRFMNAWWRRCPGRFHWLDLKVADGVPSLEARIDGNRFEFTSQRVLQCDLLLNESLVDPTRPVLVTANGRELWNAPVSWSARLALDAYLERHDPVALYNGRIPLTFPR